MLTGERATANEVWLLLGEEACDEYRNSEHLDLVADRLQGFSFASAHDAQIFVSGVGYARHSREWKHLDSGEARRLLARFGKAADLQQLRAG